jgi:hypothetical protein
MGVMRFEYDLADTLLLGLRKSLIAGATVLTGKDTRVYRGLGAKVSLEMEVVASSVSLDHAAIAVTIADRILALVYSSTTRRDTMSLLLLDRAAVAGEMPQVLDGCQSPEEAKAKHLAAMRASFTLHNGVWKK